MGTERDPKISPSSEASEVAAFFGDERRATAEAETPEAALLAARTLYDELRESVDAYGSGRNVRTTFAVDGRLVRTIEGRRP